MLKTLARPAKVSWSPSSNQSSLLATGTIEGTVNEFFETTSTLEIFDTSLGNGTPDMTSKGQVSVNESFTSLAWGTKGINDRRFPSGIVAGGMADGAVHFWDANAIMQNSSSSLIARSNNGHRGSVLGLDFHPKEPNVLASCGGDGQVLVWDLKDPSKPTFPPSLEKRLDSPMTCLQWNQSVHYILASGNNSGDTAIYDLRNKRTIINLHNSTRQRLKTNAISWNPTQGFSLAVTYSGSSLVEIWDLRKTLQPKLRMDAQSNLMSMSWNRHDPRIILTSGEDGNLALWNSETGDRLRDYPQQANTCFDCVWNPHTPSVVVTASLEGNVSVQSLHHGGSIVPSWYQKPAGVSFGFGGKLVHFSNENNQSPTKGVVNVKQVSTDETLLKLSADFQQVHTFFFVTFCLILSLLLIII